MQALVLTATAKTLDEALGNIQQQTVPIPKPKGNELLVKVEYGALNFFDTLVATDRYQVKAKCPVILGSELSGVIIAKGPRASADFQIGDRICGGVGRSSMRSGAFAEYACIGPEMCWKIPSKMRSDQAAAFPTNYGTAFMAIEQRAKASEIDTYALKRSTKRNPNYVAVITGAAGGLGTCCSQVMKALLPPTSRIVGCVSSMAKSEIALANGCTETVNYKELPKWGKVTAKKIGKFDLVADIVGGSATNECMRNMQQYGRFVVLGFAGGSIPKVPLNIPLLKNFDILGVTWGNTMMNDYSAFRQSVYGALDLFDQGLLDPMIGCTYDFNSSSLVNAYQDLVQRKSVGKLLVRIDGSATSPRISSKL